MSVAGFGGPQGTPKSLKKAKNAKKNPKTGKICPKTRIIGGILSRFFLVQALGTYTIKGGSRRAEKSRKMLMMMKAEKMEWARSGTGQEQTMSRPGAGWSKLGAGQEQYKSREEARVGQEH